MNMHRQRGFNLIEIMVVVVILGLLAAYAIPATAPRVAREQVELAMAVVDNYRADALRHYRMNDFEFAFDNEELGMPPPMLIITPLVSALAYHEGAFHVRLGDEVMPNLKNKIITVRPIVVLESPESPVSWVCGYREPPRGMVAVGSNLTDIENAFLPTECQSSRQ